MNNPQGSDDCGAGQKQIWADRSENAPVSEVVHLKIHLASVQNIIFLELSWFICKCNNSFLLHVSVMRT